jgi:adsorption protein A
LGSNRDGARFLQSGLLGGAAVALVMAAPVPGAEVPAPCPTAAPAAHRAAAEESWLQRQIRRFRGYPHLDRAYRLMKEGKAQEATDELASYLRRDPYDVAARQTYLILLYQQGRYAETACEATSLLKDESSWSDSALVYRALAEQSLGQTARALMDFRDAAANVSAPRAERVFAANSEIDLLIRNGNFAEAQKALEGIAREADDFAFYYRKGIVADALGHDVDAQSAYQAAINKAIKDSDRATALAAAGQVAMRRSRWTEASGLLRAAHEIEPHNIDLIRALVAVDRHLGKYDEAVKLIRAVLAVAVAPSRRDREVLAELSVSRKEWVRAAEQYTALLEEPGGVEDRYRLTMTLARIYRELGRHLDAEATLRKAVSIKMTPEALGTLATQLDMDGRTSEAAQILETSVALRPSEQVHAQLSVLYEKLGNRAAAITHLKDALRMADTRTLHERLGYLYAGNGSYASAAREFEQATPRRRPGLWHIHIAELYAKAGDRSSELADLDLAAAEPLEPASRRYVERQRGFLYSQLGDTEQSIEAWRAAVAAGLDDSAIHLDLGFALLQLQRWDAARAEFLRSNEREPSPRTLYYIAQCYRKLGQPDIAINYLKLAERDAQRLDPSTRKALYDELGFGYSADGKELEAAAVWRNSLGVRYDAPIALKLALAERRLGHTDEAETTARAIPYAELTVPQRIMRAELIAEILEGKRQFSGARTALMDADELQPTAEHAYRLGLLAQRAGNDSQAVDDYEKAVAREPDNLLYAESRAYAYRRAGRTKQAEELLQRIVARYPDRIAAYRELASTQLALGRQNDAASTLRHAIDAQLATTPPSEGERASEALPAMRSEYETLARRFATTVYESYRPNGGPAVGGTLNGGVIPSAGGAELSYFPAGALNRSDAALQFGARLLWTNGPSGLAIDHRSLQAGLSVRYKPLTQTDFFVGAERLVKIGANSQSDWLLRGSFGLGNEVARQTDRTHWNYWQFYADAGYFVSSRTEATYLEFRRGITLPATANLLITPHVVFAYRQQSPDPARTSISEGGPGVSFKYLSGGTRYEPHGPTFGALLQYRARLSGRGNGDWVLTVVAQF